MVRWRNLVGQTWANNSTIDFSLADSMTSFRRLRAFANDVEVVRKLHWSSHCLVGSEVQATWSSASCDLCEASWILVWCQCLNWLKEMDQVTASKRGSRTTCDSPTSIASPCSFATVGTEDPTFVAGRARRKRHEVGWGGFGAEESRERMTQALWVILVVWLNRGRTILTGPMDPPTEPQVQ